MKHLPFDPRAVKHPCGSKRGEVVAEGEIPSCLNCRRIGQRRASHEARRASARASVTIVFSPDDVVRMLAVQERYGPELLAAARERGMPTDRSTPACLAAAWLRELFGMPPREIPLTPSAAEW